MKAVFGSLLLAASLSSVFAQRAPAPPGPLPIKQVTIYTSGVSYTERAGEVDGDATVNLSFRTEQINDILKSLVQLDEGGKVRPVVYGTRDPLNRTLQSFAVDVTSNLSQADLLTKLRGVRVTVDTTNKGAITGQIVGVEQRQMALDGAKTINVPYLNLLSDSSVVSVRLDAEKSVKILDERLNKEFSEALGLLASGSDEQRRQVTLHFAGEGKRQVRVGYVSEAPLWKMTYRLVVDAKGKPYLQGWALVENTSDEDWENVRLSLVSGRPVSFIQDLYQPLYIPRPVVGNDVAASPYPQTHASGTVLAEGKEPAIAATMGGQVARKRALASGNGFGLPGPAGEKGDRGGLGGGGFGNIAPNTGRLGYDVDNTIVAMDRESVQAQAQGEKAGELFQYRIDSPVTLKRQQAAMIPVVSKEVDGAKASVYNAAWGSRFPLNVIRLHNDTGLYLRGGPVTVFDGGAYAGDARVEDVPKGESRLVSYAVDQAIEVENKPEGSRGEEVTLTLRRGVLMATRKYRNSVTYTLKSKAEEPRLVLVEHPYDPNAKLITPAKYETRTPEVYRFAVNVPAGKSETLKVETETPMSSSVAIMDADINWFWSFATKKELPAKLRETLEEVVRRRKTIQDAQSQAAGKDAEIKGMGEDQDRIRKNMAALDKASALYKRYVTELDAQETKLQGLRTDAARLRSEAEQASRSLKSYLDGITLELKAQGDLALPGEG